MTNSQKNINSENSDRISNLPDALLTNILSQLEADEVVQTCILSKRWRKLWASVPALNFNFTKFRHDTNRFNIFISSFLDFRDGDCHVHTFKLKYFSVSFENSSLVQKWIVYALQHGVKNLEVDIWGSHIRLTFSHQFNCNSLENLLLDGYFQLRLDNVCLPRLRNLSLYNIVMCDDSMQKILFGCPALVTLNMYGVSMQMNSISFPTVKSLSMENCGFYSRLDTPIISIYAPCLEYLKFVEKYGSQIAFKGMSGVSTVVISNSTKHLRNGFDLDLLSVAFQASELLS